MQNDKGEIVDMYIPRKCSATSRIIGAKDHASAQLSFVQVDEHGVMTGETIGFALSGHVRKSGIADSCLNRLLHDKKLLTFSN